jgi:TRAP-type C4-dicarboxylate transport system permease small subunit
MSEESIAEPRTSPLARLSAILTRLEDGILVLVLTAMIVLAVAQIVLRNLFASGILWGDALLRVMVLWLGMLGAMAATRDDKQITVDVLSRLLPERFKAGARVVTDLFTSGIAGVVAWNAWRLMVDDRAAGAIAFASVPVWVCELILPVAFGLIALRYLVHAGRHLEEAVRGREEG